MMWKYLTLLLTCSAITLSSAQTKVLAFAGSTRSGSVNKQLVSEAADMARAFGADVQLIDLKDYPLPFYDADLEATDGLPENAQKLRSLMMKSDVIFIASPEYNASLTAILKNTLDWASRSEKKGASREAFKGKTFVIMSASPGPRGGARGLVHLRAIIEDVGGTVAAQDFVVSGAYNAFDEQGKLKDTLLSSQLKELIHNAVVQDSPVSH